jgi:hypothetical protein
LLELRVAFGGDDEVDELPTVGSDQMVGHGVDPFVLYGVRSPVGRSARETDSMIERMIER